MSIGKLTTKANLNQLFDFVKVADIEVIPILEEHIQIVKELPFHHKDPFDRMIIGQAISTNYIVVSSDNQFKKYDISLV